MGDGNFRGATSRDEGFLLHETTNYAEGVVQASFSFVEDESIGTTADDRDGLASRFVRDACHFYDSRAGGLDLLDKFG